MSQINFIKQVLVTLISEECTISVLLTTFCKYLSKPAHLIIHNNHPANLATAGNGMVMPKKT